VKFLVNEVFAQHKKKKGSDIYFLCVSLFVCVCLCVCVCVCTYIHIYVYTDIHTQVQTPRIQDVNIECVPNVFLMCS
jgi:hypothetical protein